MHSAVLLYKLTISSDVLKIIKGDAGQSGYIKKSFIALEAANSFSLKGLVRAKPKDVFILPRLVELVAKW